MDESSTGGMKRVNIIEDGMPTIKWEIPVTSDDEEPGVITDGHKTRPLIQDYITERRFYDKYYNRAAQLRAFIDASVERRNHGAPLWKTEDVNMGLMEAKKLWLLNEVTALEVFMNDNGLMVPNWPHKGGSMVPPRDYWGGRRGGW
jgi:hypothetical protein